MQTVKQKKMLQEMELALARLIHNEEEKDFFQNFSKIVEATQDGQYGRAVALLEEFGFPAEFVGKYRRVFHAV